MRLAQNSQYDVSAARSVIESFRHMASASFERVARSYLERPEMNAAALESFWGRKFIEKFQKFRFAR